jgi:hypothetical protein
MDNEKPAGLMSGAAIRELGPVEGIDLEFRLMSILISMHQPVDEEEEMETFAPGAFADLDITEIEPPRLKPKNNDYLAFCAWCGSPTRKLAWGGFNVEHRVCTKCGK